MFTRNLLALFTAVVSLPALAQVPSASAIATVNRSVEGVDQSVDLEVGKAGQGSRSAGSTRDRKASLAAPQAKSAGPKASLAAPNASTWSAVPSASTAESVFSISPRGPEASSFTTVPTLRSLKAEWEKAKEKQAAGKADQKQPAVKKLTVVGAAPAPKQKSRFEFNENRVGGFTGKIVAPQSSSVSKEKKESAMKKRWGTASSGGPRIRRKRKKMPSKTVPQKLPSEQKCNSTLQLCTWS